MIVLDKNEAIAFLSRLWAPFDIESRFIEVVLIGPRGVRARQFDTIERGYEEAIRQALNWLERNIAKGDHVYYGVLPRAVQALFGKRGSNKDVKTGKWLWADIDFKREASEADSYGCVEGEDHALHCVYRENGKVIEVNRPPLNSILEKMEKRNLAPTIIVDSGGGYHFYWELNEPVEANKLVKLESLLVDTLRRIDIPVDPQARDLARILRLPGSVNPRTNRRVKVIKVNTIEYNHDELLERLRYIRGSNAGQQNGNIDFKELKDADIVELKETLKNVWVPGHRQDLALYLSAWFAKAHISPISMAKLLKALAEEKGDEELNQRLSTIYYSYRKVLHEEAEPQLALLDSLLETWMNEGVLNGHVSRGGSYEDRWWGRKGVQMTLEEALHDEEQVLGILVKIEEILQRASPFRDSVFEILDYERQLYAVANLRKLKVVRARRENGLVKYKEEVFIGAPTNLEVYYNPLGGVTKFKVTWETPTRPKPLVIGPAYTEDILDRLKIEGLVKHNRLARDILNAVIEGYLKKGRAVIKEEIESPGFYLLDGKIVPVMIDVEKPTIDDLKKALIGLNELAEWYGHALERFALIVKWGVVAPFGFIFKQKGTWMPWLYLYGSSYTGKTTLGEIILAIWGLDSRYKKSGSNIDSVPRLGHILSQSTFPVLVNEPGGAISRDDVVEVMKSAIESPIARGRYVKGSYVETPSLALLVFTSNKTLPRDDALLRRLIVLRFTYGERIDKTKAEEFDKNVKPKLNPLKALGGYAAYFVVNNPEIVNLGWKKLSVIVLEKAYEEAGLTPPKWIYIEPEIKDDVYEDITEAIRGYLVKRINDEFSRFVGKVTVVDESGNVNYMQRSDVDFEERVRIVMKNMLIPWAVLLENGDEKKILLTTGFADEMRSVIGDIGGLKSLAELLGWEYRRSNKVGKRVIQAIRVDLRDFIDFLSSTIFSEQ